MLEKYEQTVYLVKEGKPEPVDQAEWGHFFAEETYIIDLKGPKHRYVLCWMGPKLTLEEVTATSSVVDIVTNYENGTHITR